MNIRELSVQTQDRVAASLEAAGLVKLAFLVDSVSDEMERESFDRNPAEGMRKIKEYEGKILGELQNTLTRGSMEWNQAIDSLQRMWEIADQMDKEAEPARGRPTPLNTGRKIMPTWSDNLVKNAHTEPKMNKIATDLDNIANKLEAAGLTKLAETIDAVANDLEKSALDERLANIEHPLVVEEAGMTPAEISKLTEAINKIAMPAMGDTTVEELKPEDIHVLGYSGGLPAVWDKKGKSWPLDLKGDRQAVGVFHHVYNLFGKNHA